MSTLLASGHGALLQAAGTPVLGTTLGGLVGAAVDPSPSPSTIEVPAEDQTSPGLLGFLVTFAVAGAVILLGFSLVRHLRVVDRNARRREAADAAHAERAGGVDGVALGGAPSAGAADGEPDSGDSDRSNGREPRSAGPADQGTRSDDPAGPEPRG